MAYLLRGMNDAGDPVEVTVDFCWRCGVPVNLMLVSLEEHADSVHPPRHYPEESRHALDP